MTNNQSDIDQLYKKLDALLKRQNDFSIEIIKLRNEIDQITYSKSHTEHTEHKTQPNQLVSDSDFKQPLEEVKIKKESKISPPPFPNQKVKKPRRSKSDLEKFIGENLINKIGIIITVIGVALGAKYSIEHDLINPLTRIILGYAAGITLLFIGMRLKNKYENYSAVLVSGAMTIMYFITYSAFSFYDLIPHIVAFILMVIFTIFTVIAAINYNKQVIAIIGLVGAYAVPFLLSQNSGNYTALFTYMAIINAGILVISIKKQWKPLYYSSFSLTWLIFAFWYAVEYNFNEHFNIAFTFLIIFFVLFYLTLILNKLIQKEKLDMIDVLLILANSFIFYGFGYDLILNIDSGTNYLGLFTLGNALVHFIVSLFIYKRKVSDKNIFYLIIGLVLVFITITIPVQLDGNWVTLLWVGEATLLFWVGKKNNISIYQKLSIPLMALAFLSIVEDWTIATSSFRFNLSDPSFTPILNITFLTSILFVLAFGYIIHLNKKEEFSSSIAWSKNFNNIFSTFVSTIFIIVLYFAFCVEIVTYWNQQFSGSYLDVTFNNDNYNRIIHNHDLSKFKIIWIYNYTLLFLSLITFYNLTKLKLERFAKINVLLNLLGIVFFLAQGLYIQSELRESYLAQTYAEYYHIGFFNIGVRYISLILFTGLILVSFKTVIRFFNLGFYRKSFNYVLHTSILWIASSELLHWMDIADSSQSYKLGLSILWGSYALLMIVLGIWRNRQHLRIAGFILFAITLLKLFFYDLVHLNTISKTIVFVSLGVLLLIISFLYNKYKNIISDEIDQ